MNLGEPWGLKDILKRKQLGPVTGNQWQADDKNGAKYGHCCYKTRIATGDLRMQLHRNYFIQKY